MPRPVRFAKIFRWSRRANQEHWFARPFPQRGVGQRHQRGKGCGGCGGAVGRTARTRTAKSCGPDAPALASSLWIRSQATVARKPVTGESTKETVNHRAGKAGMPPLDLYARVRTSFAYCTRDRGCSVHPAFPAPSPQERTTNLQKLGRNAPRDREVLFQRHCEERQRRSNPPSIERKMDCFASLAMTVLRTCVTRSDVIIRESG